MTPPEPFELNSMERQSPLWLRLCDYFDARLDALHTENDGPKDAIETAHLRGRIAQLKALRALDGNPDLQPSLWRPTNVPPGPNG